MPPPPPTANPTPTYYVLFLTITSTATSTITSKLFFLLVRGGLNEVYSSFWDVTHEKFENEVLEYLDLISAYPFEAMGLFPIGPYKVMFEYTKTE